MKKISMQDIATELGLSITTVSFVLNGKAAAMGISEATVKKVEELIINKGYNPNSAARVLRTGKSQSIVLIIEDIGNHFFGNVAKFIEKIANQNGYKVFFSSTENNTQIAKSLISIMRQSGVDGFLITPTLGLEEEISRLKKDKIPFVLIDRLLHGIEADSVVVDNFWGAYQLTQHLQHFGYKKIAFVSINNRMSTFQDRKNGYLSALKEEGGFSDENLILELTFEDENEVSIGAIQRFLKEKEFIDAVFFATNYLGILGIEAIQLNNLKIGKDIGVVSFDDNDVFRLMTPSITVAAQPIKEIALRTFDILLQKIKNEKKDSLIVNEIIRPQIIIRNSSPRKIPSRQIKKKVNS